MKGIAAAVLMGSLPLAAGAALEAEVLGAYHSMPTAWHFTATCTCPPVR